ncbi:MAG: polyphosphate kinase 2 [Solirubrobacterales bacterium]|nr:polyphosphate kinase 2 [Solirubrobacterales bacterium]
MSTTEKLPRDLYEAKLYELQVQLVQMVDWVKRTGARVAIVFEGRDAAGKGGVIKRINEFVSPRVVRTVALPVPSDREQTEWYFQRYIAHLPAGGEVVLFDRSWYNRAGVEKVLGFCTEDEHRRFLRQCPTFERMLVDDGIVLLKYWFSVSEKEQAKRFESRIDDPLKQWKLSSTDLYSRSRWVDYSRAKDEMFKHTDIPEARWHVVESDIKRNARINCIAHLLKSIPFEHEEQPRVKLPKVQKDGGYERPPEDLYAYVPDVAGRLIEQAKASS